ncbi:MAG: V-type ATP synthase subunit D [Candidatus Hydrogenedentes bacterium]|nr:V-type ATP synthase subunit D [Candidatus Hydrogenedentota bacterium]
MPRYEVAPTRTNLMRIKEDLEFALEGYELLEQKRDILITEIERFTGLVTKAQQDVDAALAEAFAALREAKFASGESGLRSAGSAVNVSVELSIKERHVMGVAVPTVELSVSDKLPHYGPTMTSVWTDEAVTRFHAALVAIGVLAQMQTAVLRLARAIQKTIRRVNALEKLLIPDYRETKKFVEESLEDSDRDALSLLKLVKDRMEEASQRDRTHSISINT